MGGCERRAANKHDERTEVAGCGIGFLRGIVAVYRWCFAGRFIIGLLQTATGEMGLRLLDNSRLHATPPVPRIARLSSVIPFQDPIASLI